jgi:hypothetical protein
MSTSAAWLLSPLRRFLHRAQDAVPLNKKKQKKIEIEFQMMVQIKIEIKEKN